LNLLFIDLLFIDLFINVKAQC